MNILTALINLRLSMIVLFAALSIGGTAAAEPAVKSPNPYQDLVVHFEFDSNVRKFKIKRVYAGAMALASQELAAHNGKVFLALYLRELKMNPTLTGVLFARRYQDYAGDDAFLSDILKSTGSFVDADSRDITWSASRCMWVFGETVKSDPSARGAWKLLKKPVWIAVDPGYPGDSHGKKQ